MIPRRRFSPKTYAGIIARQKGRCACGCREKLGTDPTQIHYDHWIPLWNDGPDTEENLHALKVRHHLAKTRKEAKARAKGKRIQERDGLRRRRMNAGDKVLAKILEGR